MLKKEPRTMFSGRSIVFESGGRGQTHRKILDKQKKAPPPDATSLVFIKMSAWAIV